MARFCLCDNGTLFRSWVEQHACRLTTTNAIGLIERHDPVLDGSHHFFTRDLINDVCALLNKPWVYGSVQRFEGQVSVFNKGSQFPVTG